MDAVAIPTTEEQAAEAEAPDEVVAQPAARVGARAMFKYSEYVHVGDGAEECPTAVALAAGDEPPACEDIDHFHAWCRLPNPFQAQDIRKKGLAAKAREIRALRDPESDGSVILDEELSAVNDPIFVDTIIDELLAREWAEDYLEAQHDVDEREEFEHFEQDREEYNRLSEAERELPDEEQSDEYKRLDAHMTSYITATRDRLAEVQDPKRAELKARSVEDIVGLVRAKRVEGYADHAFVETYNSWMWFVGTFRVELHPSLRRPYLPKWEEMGVKDKPAAGTMFGEAPEVIDALKATFNALQIALQRASAGN